MAGCSSSSSNNNENALKGLVFCMSGTLSKSRREFEDLIVNHGGSVSSSVTNSTTHLVTTEIEYKSETAKVSKAKSMDSVSIVSEQFVHECIRVGDSAAVDASEFGFEKQGSSSANNKRKREGDDADNEDEDFSDVEQQDEEGGDYENDDDDEEELGSGDDDEEGRPKKRRRAVVDEEYDHPEMATVARNTHGGPLDIYLLTGEGGKERFYKMQVLEHGTNFILFAKYGSVGGKSRKLSKSYDTLEKATREYRRRVRTNIGKGYRVRDPNEDPLYDPDDYSDEEEVSRESQPTVVVEKIDFVLLPEDSQLHVFEYCDHKQIARLCQLNKRFSNLLTADRFWIANYQNNFNKIPSPETPTDTHSYRRRSQPNVDPSQVTDEELNKMVKEYYDSERKRQSAVLREIIQKYFSRVNAAMEIDAKNTGNDLKVYPSMNVKTLFQRALAVLSRSKLRTKTIMQISDNELTYEEEFTRFIKMRNLTKIKRLDIKAWDSEMMDANFSSVVDSIVNNKDSLSHLKALSLADLEYSECEISWIVLGNITPILEALPNLLFFDLRGSQELVLSPITHYKLLSLTLVTGGLPSNVMEGVFKSNLPNLSHLVLYLGTDDYGADPMEQSKNALKILLTEEETGKFPSLQHLGLVNSQQIDHFCDILVSSAIIKRILHLDLSQGCLGDEGFTQLLKLKDKDTCLLSIDVAHNYIVKRTLATELLGMGILIKNLNVERDGSGDYRYPAIGE